MAVILVADADHLKTFFTPTKKAQKLSGLGKSQRVFGRTGSEKQGDNRPFCNRDCHPVFVTRFVTFTVVATLWPAST
jgi:hypothetical protein